MQLETIEQAEWLQRIQAEYREVPGLHLTKPQFQRLWGLDAPLCDSLVAALVAERFLRPTTRNGFVRVDA